MFLRRAARISVVSLQKRSNHIFSTGVEMHQASLENSSQFWGNAANGINWVESEGPVLASNGHFSRWFPGRKLNMCFNCVDRHVIDGRGEQPAIIFDSPVTNSVRKVTYNKLLDDVCSFSTLLLEQGVKKGDRVLIYMPNLPETAVAMLSCARIGAIHSVVFGGFAPSELAVRIKDCAPKLIVFASCGIDGAKVLPYKPLVDAAIALSADVHLVERCIMFQREQGPVETLTAGRDIDWTTSIQRLTSDTAPADLPGAVCSANLASDPLYILYTSGFENAFTANFKFIGYMSIPLCFYNNNFFHAG